MRIGDEAPQDAEDAEDAENAEDKDEEDKVPQGDVWLRASHMSDGVIDAGGFKPHEPDGWHRTGWGEVIIAVAERAADGWAEEATRRVQPLSRHKRPRGYVAVEELPRNAQGKISRRKVRDLVLATHDFSDGPYPSLARKALSL